MSVSAFGVGGKNSFKGGRAARYDDMLVLSSCDVVMSSANNDPGLARESEMWPIDVHQRSLHQSFLDKLNVRPPCILYVDT